MAQTRGLRYGLTEQAQVAELVDALASGASALKYGRGSSSLLLGTIWGIILRIPPNPGYEKMKKPDFILHEGDLPQDVISGPVCGIDTEATGLLPGRDRLCLVQVYGGSGPVHIIRIAPGQKEAPVLAALLADKAITKIFHYARFDMGMFFHHFGVMPQPIYCTKIASKLARTYGQRHGFKEICRDLLNVDISKNQQTSDWGRAELSPAQLAYAANDSYWLPALKEKLDAMLAREGRSDFAQVCFDFLPMRVRLDLAGWREDDLFAH